MTSPTEQQFLNEVDMNHWAAADRQCSSNDAAVYKHAVVGLIIHNYGSDSVEMRQQEVLARMVYEKNPCHQASYGSGLLPALRNPFLPKVSWREVKVNRSRSDVQTPSDRP